MQVLNAELHGFLDLFDGETGHGAGTVNHEDELAGGDLGDFKGGLGLDHEHEVTVAFFGGVSEKRILRFGAGDVVAEDEVLVRDLVAFLYLDHNLRLTFNLLIDIVRRAGKILDWNPGVYRQFEADVVAGTIFWLQDRRGDA
ncbi:hypothetical protein ES703_24551 [subsurface metagenome]